MCRRCASAAGCVLHARSCFKSHQKKSLVSKAITLSLPYPPSTNVYWRKHGAVTYLSKKGRLFKTAVAEYVNQNNIPKLGDVPLEVLIVLRPRTRSKFMDIDNCCKAVLDSCQDAGVFDDDNQVTRLVVERGDYIKGGACVVVLQKREPNG